MMIPTLGGSGRLGGADDGGGEGADDDEIDLLWDLFRSG
jgi:hypothetical protein